MSETGTTYYRTLHGSHRHTTHYCANKHRSIFSGEVLTMAAGEVPNYAPCAECNAAELAEWQAPATKTLCPNSGVTRPQRIYSTCKDCGKEGKVTGGRIRNHEAKEQRKK